jgi:hypothetical protein
MRSWRGTWVVEANANTAALQVCFTSGFPRSSGSKDPRHASSRLIRPHPTVSSFSHPIPSHPSSTNAKLPASHRPHIGPHAPLPHISRDHTPLRNPPRLRQFAGDAAIDSQTARLGLITDCGRLRLRLVKSVLWSRGEMLECDKAERRIFGGIERWKGADSPMRRRVVWGGEWVCGLAVGGNYRGTSRVVRSCGTACDVGQYFNISRTYRPTYISQKFYSKLQHCPTSKWRPRNL